MSRNADWVDQMFATIDAHTDLPFEWGVNDCCIFVARVIDAMTGSVIEADLSAEYSDEETALAFIASHGSLEAAVSVFLGDPTSGMAMRGDAVLLDGGDGPAMGIMLGDVIAAMGPDGLVYVPRGEALMRWAV